MEELTLDTEEDNPVDPNAIRVLRQNGEQIGYLNSELASDVVRDAARGCRFAAYIKNLTGGTHGKELLGVNLLFVVVESGVTDAESQRYVDGIDFGD